MSLKMCIKLCVNNVALVVFELQVCARLKCLHAAG